MTFLLEDHAIFRTRCAARYFFFIHRKT